MTRTTETVDECARRIVGEDVLVCLSSLIYELNSNYDVISTLDIEDEMMELNSRDDYEEPVEDHLNALERDELVQLLEEAGFQCYDHESISQLAAAYLEHLKTEDELRSYAEDNRVDPFIIEAYEHWAVTSYLARKLRDQGETVVELFNLQIWARTTTGQMICMDGVMQRIAQDILNY